MNKGSIVERLCSDLDHKEPRYKSPTLTADLNEITCGCCVKAKYEALKEEYTTYSRILHETEDALARVNVERTHCTNELNEIQRDIATQYREKVRLEDEILEKIRAQLTADKAAQYSARIVRHLRERTKDLEEQV